MWIQNIHCKQLPRPAISRVIKRQGLLIWRYEVSLPADMRIMNGDRGQELTLCGAMVLRGLQPHWDNGGRETPRAVHINVTLSRLLIKKRTGLTIKSCIGRAKEREIKQARKPERRGEEKECVNIFQTKGEKKDIRQNGGGEILQRFWDGWDEVMWSRVKERERREMVVWEFRNLSTICISMSAIYMQMTACMSDRKARSRDFFFFFSEPHYPERCQAPAHTSTHQHKTHRAADDTGHLTL